VTWPGDWPTTVEGGGLLLWGLLHWGGLDAIVEGDDNILSGISTMAGELMDLLLGLL